jgi:hypothetical protein
VDELVITIVFVTPTQICSLGGKDVSNAMGSTCLHLAIRIDPVTPIPVTIGQEMEMLSIEETFLMVVISTITTRDTLGIFIGLVATIEGKKIDPLITLETSPVHIAQTSKKV